MLGNNFNGGIILNIDVNTATDPFLKHVVENNSLVTKEDLYPFIDQYLETQVNTLSINTFAQLSFAPSKVWTDIYTKYEQEYFNGEKVDNKEYYKWWYLTYKQHGIDPYEVFFKRSREVGIKVWNSFRLNDCHFPGQINYFKGDFYLKAIKNGWTIGADYGHHRDAFNFAVPEVRDITLKYYEEQLDNYDVDGIEIDAMREPVTIDYFNLEPKKVLNIMNDFFRDVKKLITKAEEKYGHKIEFAIRLPRNSSDCKILGFDVDTLTKENIIDHIIVSPRYNTCDNDMPISYWKELYPTVKVSPAIIELNITYTDENGFVKYSSDKETANGLASAYVSQGADQIYLFDYYILPKGVKDIYGGWRDNYQEYVLNDALRTIGKGETIFNSNRRHVVTYQDFTPTKKGVFKHNILYPNVLPEGFNVYKPFPMEILSGNEKEISVPVGYVPNGKKANIIVGLTKGNIKDIEIIVNDEIANGFTPCKTTSIDFNTGKPFDKGYCPPNANLFKAEISAKSLNKYQVKFKAKREVTIEYLEIEIN